MPIETGFEINTNYVHFHCRGVYNLSDMLDALSAAFAAAAKNNAVGLLVDMSELQGPEPNTLDRFQLSTHAVKLVSQYGMHFRIAAVGDIPMIDPGRFTETVARNRGLNARAFTDINEAIAWLESEGT